MRNRKYIYSLFIAIFLFLGWQENTFVASEKEFKDLSYTEQSTDKSFFSLKQKHSTFDIVGIISQYDYNFSGISKIKADKDCLWLFWDNPLAFIDLSNDIKVLNSLNAKSSLILAFLYPFFFFF